MSDIKVIKFYGYKKCGTCRKAEKVLVEKNIAYTFIDITENPPSAATLKKMIKLADIEAHLKDLTTLKNELTLLLNLCHGSKNGCPIIEELNINN